MKGIVSDEGAVCSSAIDHKKSMNATMQIDRGLKKSAPQKHGEMMVEVWILQVKILRFGFWDYWDPGVS